VRSLVRISYMLMPILLHTHVYKLRQSQQNPYRELRHRCTNAKEFCIESEHWFIWKVGACL